MVEPLSLIDEDDEDDDEQRSPFIPTLARVEGHLWVSMRLFAQPEEVQIAFLVHQRIPNSLAALARGWSGSAAPEYLALDLITKEEADAALAIDQILTGFEAAHGHRLGTIETLRTNPGWATIRRLAAESVASHDARAVPWTDPEFLSLFAQLRPAVDWWVDPADEHDRWSVYHAVVRDPALRPIVLACIVRDSEPAMASAVLIELLVVSPAVEREAIFAATPTLHNKTAESRMTDLAILERFRDDPVPMTPEEANQLLAASAWCQRRMTEQATALDALTLLAEHGATRNIRTDALKRHKKIVDRPICLRFTNPQDTHEATPEEIDGLLAVSPELQRRIARESMVANALEALAEHGHTRLIRGLARDALHNRLRRSR
jgi:hypothetical protein